MPFQDVCDRVVRQNMTQIERCTLNAPIPPTAVSSFESRDRISPLTSAAVPNFVYFRTQSDKYIGVGVGADLRQRAGLYNPRRDSALSLEQRRNFKQGE